MRAQGFIISISLGGAPCIGDGEANSELWGEQSISAHVNIPASTIALHTPEPLPVTFTEEMGDTPS